MLQCHCSDSVCKEHGKIGFDVHTFALHVYLLRCVVVKTTQCWNV